MAMSLKKAILYPFEKKDVLFLMEYPAGRKKDVSVYVFCFISDSKEENAMAESKLLVKREGDFRYPICFEEDFSNLAQVMREEGLADRKICIVTDSNVGPLYEAPVKKALSEVSSDISVFTFEAGEKNKNL